MVSAVSECCECHRDSRQLWATQGRCQLRIDSQVIKNNPSYSKHLKEMTCGAGQRPNPIFFQAEINAQLSWMLSGTAGNDE